MKIMLLTHSFTPEISPPQRRWSIIVDELAQLGHVVTVVAPTSSSVATDNQRQLLDNPRVKLKKYPSLRRSRTMLGKLLKHGVNAMLSTPTALSGGKPDIIIATVPAIPTLFVGYVTSRLRRVPLIVDLRDAWPDLLRESQVIKFRWLEPPISKFIRFIMRRSEMLITVTYGHAQKLQFDGLMNVKTISNGVETEGPDLSVAPRNYNGELHILYLGNIGRSQGLDTAIRGMRHVPPSVQLRIVGQGTEKSKLVNLADELGVNVDFRDPVHGQDLLDNYSWADTCLVSLRPDWESFSYTVPSKLYELLYLNQHVTGLVQGEAAEIIIASESGSVVEQSARAFADYINSMLANPDSLQTERRGKEWVTTHASLRQSGRKYSMVLAEVVRANSNR